MIDASSSRVECDGCRILVEVFGSFRACYDNYCDYYKCIRLLGEVDDCKLFKRYFETICPNFWISHWDELREKGAFPGPI